MCSFLNKFEGKIIYFLLKEKRIALILPYYKL